MVTVSEIWYLFEYMYFVGHNGSTSWFIIKCLCISNILNETAKTVGNGVSVTPDYPSPLHCSSSSKFPLNPIPGGYFKPPFRAGEVYLPPPSNLGSFWVDTLKLGRNIALHGNSTYYTQKSPKNADISIFFGLYQQKYGINSYIFIILHGSVIRFFFALEVM